MFITNAWTRQLSHHNLLLVYTQNQKHSAWFCGSQISVGSSEVEFRLILNRDNLAFISQKVWPASRWVYRFALAP